MDLYKNIALQISKRYLDHLSLIGIIWIGSSTFGIDDRDTDIDIRLLINSGNKSQPMKQFREQEVKIEVDEMSWSWLIDDVQPDSDQYWIREKCIILYDPKQKIQKKFNSLHNKITKNRDENLWKKYKVIFSDYEIEKCIRRKEFEAALMYFYQSIQSITSFLFVFNNEPVPPLKWRLYFLKKAKWIPKDVLNEVKICLNAVGSINQKWQNLVTLEQKIQNMMIQRGYEVKKVKEYWKF